MTNSMYDWKETGRLDWKRDFDFSGSRRLVINVKLVTKKMGPLSGSVAKGKSPAQKLDDAKNS